jgi:hypothetical protein
MLISRSALFLCFQVLIALVLAGSGMASAWAESARWWLFAVVLTNFVSICLLIRLFRAEGRRYSDAIRFSRPTLKTDLAWLFGSSVIGLPIAAAPMTALAAALFGDPMTPLHMMFRPLPGWALAVGVLFPITIAFSELPTYFGYAMPRLFPTGGAQAGASWLAWLVASFFLGAQHVFLPLILDGRFILWRLGMYLPFALYAGLMLKFRPTLLPYFMVVHALVDVSTLSVYLMI